MPHIETWTHFGIFFILSCTKLVLVQGFFSTNGIGKDLTGSSNIGESSCFDNYAGELSTDDFPISDFEIHDNCGLTHNVVTEGIQVNQDDDAMPPTKKSRKSRAEHTDIYRNQPRLKMDTAAESQLNPFMIQLDQFLKSKKRDRQKASADGSYLGRRIQFLTHEFLLMLVKAHWTYDSNPHEIHSTLVEGFGWLLDIWRTVPVESLKLRYLPKVIENKGAYSPDTIEFAISVMLGNQQLFNNSQCRFISYAVLSWMKKFRSNWFECFIEASGRQFERIPEYKKSRTHTNVFRCLIHTAISALDESNTQEIPNPNKILEDHQTILPQFHTTNTYYTQHLPCSPDILPHGDMMEKGFTGSSNTGKSSCVHKYSGALSMDDFPISAFEIHDCLLKTGSGFDWAGHTPGSVDFSSQDETLQWPLNSQ
ncbi:uncharacterized protein MELLADRAFT_108640 [Melampsora larici-populina 98AG31]|uniref:Uncharacterized protein n=1 Tax=Melampsora larici-populina (strain 98AG31 / pathotype 3-4-7) TaxID=747676 RepID=F4RTS1_MELLP|nr:uncharacterized protein MELLADRAFT_108640 [Melampsora larici-populina 98AG31]EGG04211.1 hypothetical protein MELLADRAFT_108640 [Melampsora larici-populina 98AG31]